MNTENQHLDRLGRPVAVDDIVAFTWRQATGVRIGRVVKLTAKRVRIAYTSEYTHKGKTDRWAGQHVTCADGVVVIDSTTQQHITLQALQGLIP